MILNTKPLELDITKSEDSEKKYQIIKSKIPTVVVNVTKIEVKAPENMQINQVTETVVTVIIASIAIFVKQFVVVDIVINFFGKINVELGPRISKIVDFLKKVQMPTLRLTEQSSPIDDGGDAAIQSNRDYINSKNRKDFMYGSKQQDRESILDKNLQENKNQYKYQVKFYFLSFQFLILILEPNKILI